MNYVLLTTLIVLSTSETATAGTRFVETAVQHREQQEPLLGSTVWPTTLVYDDKKEHRVYIQYDDDYNLKPLCTYSAYYPMSQRQWPWIHDYVPSGKLPMHWQKLDNAIYFTNPLEVTACAVTQENILKYSDLKLRSKVRKEKLLAYGKIAGHKIKLKATGGGIECEIKSPKSVVTPSTSFLGVQYASYRSCDTLEDVPASDNMMVTGWKNSRFVVWNPQANMGAVLYGLTDELPTWELLPSLPKSLKVQSMYVDTENNLRIAALGTNEYDSEEPKEFYLTGFEQEYCQWAPVRESNYVEAARVPVGRINAKVRKYLQYVADKPPQVSFVNAPWFHWNL